MKKLLWAERKKIRRSSVVWIGVFGAAMAAVIIFLLGQEVYYGPQDMYYGTRYIDHSGWYMNETQSLGTFFVLPAVIALLGSYILCREEQEDTIKSLRMIPVNESKLAAAKMILTFGFGIFLYVLLFVLTFLTESFLHYSELPPGMILGFLKEYFLDGVGICFAVSPIIALVARVKKGYWLALVFAEIYSFTGLFAGMSDVLTTFYPITAAFNLSGHYGASGNKAGSMISLLLCGGFSAFLLIGKNRYERN